MATSTICAAGPRWRPASMWPGLVYVAVLVGAAYGLSQLMSTVSAPLWAFGLGMLAAPAARAAHIPAAGIAYASRTPLRAGIA